MKNRVFAVAVAALLAGGSEPSVSATPHIAFAPVLAIGDSAAETRPQIVSGHADIISEPFNSVVVDEYSFSAVHQPNGDIAGQFEFRARYQDVLVRAHGVIECMTVTGNKARLGGHVTQSTFTEGIPLGAELTWSVTDNGEGSRNAPDTASQLLGSSAAAYCTGGLAYPEAPVRRGNIQVRP